MGAAYGSRMDEQRADVVLGSRMGKDSMTDKTPTTTLPAFWLGIARPDAIGRNGGNTAGILPGEPNRLTHKVSKLSFGSAEA